MDKRRKALSLDMLWMDEILHHFETMGIHCLLILGIIIPGFLRWSRISSLNR